MSCKLNSFLLNHCPLAPPTPGQRELARPARMCQTNSGINRIQHRNQQSSTPPALHVPQPCVPAVPPRCVTFLTFRRYFLNIPVRYFPEIPLRLCHPEAYGETVGGIIFNSQPGITQAGVLSHRPGTAYFPLRSSRNQP